MIKNIFNLLLLFSLVSYGEVKLPKLISDGIVLQRDTEIKIWGWADKNEKVEIHFLNSTYNISADSNSEWSIMIPAQNAGGPFEMRISADNEIIIKDILFGDVWVCSGQSNMELPVRRVSWIYEDEIVSSENKFIRQFLVPDRYNFNEPEVDLTEGSWKSANPENILEFSAVGYFFAKNLYEKYQVPIGLINSSLGGSPAEAWMSEDALREFPVLYEEAQKFKDSSLIEKIESEDKTRINAWYAQLRKNDKGYKDPGNPWYNPEYNSSDWATIKIPGYWADENPGFVNGVVWFRKQINVPASMTGEKARLILGRIVDADSVFINGYFIGTTSYQYPPRRYDIPSGILEEGKNIIVVRVINNSGRGGFVQEKTYEIISDGKKLDLTGDWEYRLGAEMDPLKGETFIRWKPLGLYNAMISPLLNYKIKGVIWYQGESNAGRPIEYSELFPAMINNWREKWNQDKLPFLFVQLTNFMEAKDQPSESNWALLREAQLKTLSLHNTAMAVTIDIGEGNDIHPLNKKDVGYRLALAAENLAYGDDVVYSGPVYQSMEIENNRIILSFSHSGSGLVAKGNDELKYFSISGADSEFVWANAKIENDKVIVWHDKITNPVAVRYAWADNPEGANLYNKEGLPASPFRTDEFNSIILN